MTETETGGETDGRSARARARAREGLTFVKGHLEGHALDDVADGEARAEPAVDGGGDQADHLSHRWPAPGLLVRHTDDRPRRKFLEMMR